MPLVVDLLVRILYLNSFIESFVQNIPILFCTRESHFILATALKSVTQKCIMMQFGRRSLIFWKEKFNIFGEKVQNFGRKIQF